MNLNDLKRKVGQLIIVEIPGKKITAETEAFIRECHPAGVILFGSNLSGPWASAEFIAGLQAIAAAAGDDPLLIGMDQEGGQVSHLRYPCAEMPSNMARAAAGLDAVEQSARILGTEMVRLGINLGLAPVVDVNTNPANPVIGTRAFSDDPETVAACTAAAIRGMRESGVLSMAKHFPGHGATSVDSHVGLPLVPYGWERLRGTDLLPFRAAIEAGVDTMITAHVVYPGVDKSNLAATLSRALMTDLLRKDLGFKGALFSDALVMEAITGGDGATIPPAAIACIRAGVDCAMLFGSLAAQRRSYEALLGAAEYGIIPERRLEEAAARITELRRRVAAPEPLAAWPDMDHLWASRRISQASITLVRDEQGLLPLASEPGGAGLGVVEFSSGRTAAVEGARNEPLIGSSLAMLLGRKLPEARFLALTSSAPNAEGILDSFLSTCERVVVASRNAALDSKQADLLKHIAALCAGKPVVQIAMRGPYDANIEPLIGTVLLSYGDQPESVAAIVDVLLGEAMPTGNLPVRLTSAEPVAAL